MRPIRDDFYENNSGIISQVTKNALFMVTHILCYLFHDKSRFEHESDKKNIDQKFAIVGLF